MAWPSGRDYEVALQNPRESFIPGILKTARVDTDRRGLPVKRSGNFACVFRAQVGPRRRAIRCFTLEVAGIQRRYSRLRQFTRHHKPPSFVDFDYRTEAIRIGGDNYPVLLMDWVEGQPLDEFIGANLQSPEKLAEVAGRFQRLVRQLQRQFEVAHNDLQHGNVLALPNGELRLVDYDGVYLPEFQGQSSPETGEPNYQHPARTAADYDVWIDNFPALVIYLSLLAVSADPSLWERFNKQNNLLLSAADYRNPAESLCFQELQASPDPVVARLAAELERCCALPVADVPYLDDLLAAIRPPVSAPASPPAPADAPAPALAPPPPETDYAVIRQIIREELQQTLAAHTPSPAPAPAAAARNDIQALQASVQGLPTRQQIAQVVDERLRDSATQNDLRRLEAALQSLPSREQIAGLVDERLQDNVPALRDIESMIDRVVQAKLNDVVTKNYLKSYLTLISRDIATKADLDARLRDLPTKADLDAQLQGLVTRFVAKADLDARLQNVAAKTDLARLRDVPTKADLDARLRDVASKSDMDFYLQGVVTGDYLDDRLRDMATISRVRVLLGNLPNRAELLELVQQHTTVECGQCQERSLIGREFCANAECGASLLHGQKNCVNCQSLAPGNAVYCPHCGHSSDVLAPPTRRWRLWLPHTRNQRNGRPAQPAPAAVPPASKEDEKPEGRRLPDDWVVAPPAFLEDEKPKGNPVKRLLDWIYS